MIEAGHLVLQAGKHNDKDFMITVVFVFHYQFGDFGTFQHPPPLFPMLHPYKHALVGCNSKRKANNNLM